MKVLSKITAIGLLVAILFSGALAGAAEPVNLLDNGGFEEGLTGWNPDPEHSLVHGGAAAHSGKACLTGELTVSNIPVRSPLP